MNAKTKLELEAEIRRLLAVYCARAAEPGFLPENKNPDLVSDFATFVLEEQE
jgi:hypothetical protein